MNPSIVLVSAARLLVPLMLLFALFLLVRGHSAAGGGFAAGLVASAAFALYAVALGPDAARAALPLHPRFWLASGLGLALASGAAPLLAGGAFLEGSWLVLELGGMRLELGTPLLFDLGVFLVVAGSALTVLLELARDLVAPPGRQR